MKISSRIWNNKNKWRNCSALRNHRDDQTSIEVKHETSDDAGKKEKALEDENRKHQEALGGEY